MCGVWVVWSQSVLPYLCESLWFVVVVILIVRPLSYSFSRLSSPESFADKE